MTRRGFTGAAVPTTIVGSMTTSVPAAGGTFTLGSATGWTFVNPFVVVIDRGAAAEEKILCSLIAGTTVTVGQRGYDGTQPQAHSPGASILHVLDSLTVDEMNAAAEFGNAWTWMITSP
jgi:hypothetical protein